MTVNGEKPEGGQGAGGAGGSIFITCHTIAGTGSLSAKGGDQGRTITGVGGGGRISVVYNTTAQASVSPAPAIAFLVHPARRFFDSQAGTLHFPDNVFFLTSDTDTISGSARDARISIPSFTEWAPESLTLTNARIELLNMEQLTTANDLTIENNAELIMQSGADLEAGRDIIIQNSAALIVQTNGWLKAGGNLLVKQSSALTMNTGASLRVAGYMTVTGSSSAAIAAAATNAASPTNDIGTFHGAHLDVGGMLTLAESSTLYVISDPTNGGSVLLTVGEAFVDATSVIDANGTGYMAGDAVFNLDGYGPGGGLRQRDWRGSGAGYGGEGGNIESIPGGVAYGSEIGPGRPGSGGPSVSINNAGLHHGGGFIWMESTGTIIIDGTLSANGLTQTSRGAGAGGGIEIHCRKLAGGGSMRARGANAGSATSWGGGGGGGGGGRIMVWIWPYRYSAAMRAGILDGNIPHWVTIAANEPYHPVFSPGDSPVSGGTGYGNGEEGTVRFLNIGVPARISFSFR